MMTTSPSETETPSDRAPRRTLVVGSDGALAEPIVAALHARGESVATVGTSGFGLAEEYGGDARAIDFGLSGRKYQELIATATRLVLAIEPDRSKFREPSASRHVRAAAESLEFIRAGGARDGFTFLSSLLAFGTALGTVGEGDFNVGQGFASPFEESLALAEQVARRARAHTSALGVLRVGPLVGNATRGVIDQGSLLAELLSLVRSGALHAETIWTEKPFLFDTVDRVGARLGWMSTTAFDGVLHLILPSPPTDREVFEWLSTGLEGEKPRAAKLLGFRRRPAQSALNGPERRAFGWGLRFARSHESFGADDELAWTDLLKALIAPSQSARDHHE